MIAAVLLVLQAGAVSDAGRGQLDSALLSWSMCAERFGAAYAGTRDSAGDIADAAIGECQVEETEAKVAMYNWMRSSLSSTARLEGEFAITRERVRGRALAAIIKSRSK